MPRPLKTPFAEGLRRIGKPLIEETGRMFDWWHRVRDGTLSRASFRVYMRSLSARVEALLSRGIERGDEKTARTCAKLLKAKVAFWTFVRVEGDKPTNNSAERAVRHGVIVRKISGGTKSEGGSRFIERILTVRATLRLQRRTILPFILTACEARLRRTTPPSLVRVATAGPRESSPQLRIAA